MIFLSVIVVEGREGKDRVFVEYVLRGRYIICMILVVFYCNFGIIILVYKRRV